jgi:hypothetical protein
MDGKVQPEKNDAGHGIARRRRTAGFWLARVRAGEVEEVELEDLNKLGRRRELGRSGDVRGALQANDDGKHGRRREEELGVAPNSPGSGSFREEDEGDVAVQFPRSGADLGVVGDGVRMQASGGRHRRRTSLTLLLLATKRSRERAIQRRKEAEREERVAAVLQGKMREGTRVAGLEDL